MLIADKILQLKATLKDLDNLVKNEGVAIDTTDIRERVLDLSQTLMEASQDGFTFCDESGEVLGGDATYDDIAEKVELNILEEQANDLG